MGRLESVDGLRGVCLVFMTITHLHFGREYLLGHLHFRQLGFADSAQAFIFLSGLLVGLVGMRQHARHGARAVRRRCHRRALELYGWHLGLVLALLLASRFLPEAWPAWGDWLQRLFDDGDAAALATAGLLYQPTYLDILPQYMLYLLAAPFAIGLVARGRAGVVAAASLLAWLAAQAGLQAELAATAAGLLGADVPLRSYFNPLGWQLAFFSGLLAGALLESGALRPERLFRPELRFLPQLALGLALGMMALRLLLTFGLLGPETSARLGSLERKEDLGPLAALSFAALAYLVGWLLNVAPTARSTALRRLGNGLRALLAHPWLTLLGRHSLPVFACHVLMVYALRYADARLGPVPDPWFSLAALGVIAGLFLIAAALEAKRAVAPAGAAGRPEGLTLALTAEPRRWPPQLRASRHDHEVHDGLWRARPAGPDRG